MTALRLADVGERALIRRLIAGLPIRDNILVGPGDDCAVVHGAGADEDWLLTSDPVIEGIHFLPDAPPAAIGHKAIGRVLSDIAAMGGEARWALVNLVAPETAALARVEGIYQGLRALAARHGMAVVGGDVARGPRLELHVFGVGAAPRGTAVTRAGGRPGDVLVVTGALGGSRLGRHLTFEPRLAEGRRLRGVARAMIDLSDGLATDLRHVLAASGVGALIEAEALPLSADAESLRDDHDAGWHALHDGEDFELLAALPPDAADRLLDGWPRDGSLAPLTRIGRLTDEAGRLYVRRADRTELWQAGGYEHFVE